MPAGKIDRMLDLVGEVVLNHRRLAHSVGAAAGLPEDVERRLSAEQQLLGELTDSAVRMRTLPVSAITGPLPRAIRDIAQAVGKQVEFIVTGGDTELDRAILESLAEPLTHLLRNAVSHGIEPPDERVRAGKPACGRLELHAVPRGSLVEISVIDDGRGIAAATAEEAEREGSLTDVLARPGYSTAAEVTDLAGRGVGMDAVQAYARSVGGTLEVRSQPGHGLEATLVLPLALAQLEVLLLRRGPDVYGIPIAAVDEVLLVTETQSVQGQLTVPVRGHPVPLADIAAVLGLAAPPLPRASGRGHRVRGRAAGRDRVRPADRGRGSRGQAAGPAGPGGRLPGRDHPRRRPGRPAHRARLVHPPGRGGAHGAARPARRGAGEGRPPPPGPPPHQPPIPPPNPAPASRTRSWSSRIPLPCANCSAASSRRPGTGWRPPKTATRHWPFCIGIRRSRWWSAISTCPAWTGWG